MHNDDAPRRIHLRLKRLNLTVCADNRKIRNRIRTSNIFRKIYFYTIPLFAFLFFILEQPYLNCYLFKNYSGIAIVALSISIFAISAALKKRARNESNLKGKDGFFVPTTDDFKESVNTDLTRIKGLCKFKYNLLELALIQYRNKWNYHGEMHYLFGGTTALWVISLIVGPMLGYELSKALPPPTIDAKNLIQNILENNFFWILIWYIIGALAYAVDRSYDENAGKAPRQRRDYMIALIECAIRIKSEENRKTEQISMPVSPPLQPSPAPQTSPSPSKLPLIQDRSVCFLTQLRNFICK